MLVRLGFVAMSMNLKDCSPSGTVTLGTLNKLTDQDKRKTLWAKAEKNIKNTIKIMEFAVKKGIYVYRLSSKLIPFATHDIAANWDYIKDLSFDLNNMGKLIRDTDLRVSAHPDHFTVINTPNEEIFFKSLADLSYHDSLFKAMGVDTNDGKLVLHIGGTYKNKDKSKAKFIENFRMIPTDIRKRIILENDDKSFNSLDVLEICKELEVPMVVDIHHYYCNNQGENLMNILDEAFKLWGRSIPKIHFSSPKSCKEFRSHADYINSQDFIKFIFDAKELKRDFDIMIEAKEKDKAVMKLIKDIQNEKNLTFTPGLCQFSLE